MMPTDTRHSVRCSVCGYRGKGSPDAEYQASIMTPEWQPGDIYGEVFGDCACGEPLAWDDEEDLWRPLRERGARV